METLHSYILKIQKDIQALFIPELILDYKYNVYFVNKSTCIIQCYNNADTIKIRIKKNTNLNYTITYQYKNNRQHFECEKQNVLLTVNKCINLCRKMKG